MVPDLGCSKGESAASKVGFCPGNVQERLARGMQQMTGLVVRYKIIKVITPNILERSAIMGCHGYISFHVVINCGAMERKVSVGVCLVNKQPIKC